MAVSDNPMVADLCERLDKETTLAIEHKENDGKDTNPDGTPKVAIPEFHRAMGVMGRNLAVNLSDESFKEAGLTASDITKARDVGTKLRDWYVSKYGDVPTGFDSKRGTSIVQSLKSLLKMAQDGVYDLSPADASAINESVTAWYENAPLRGRAAKVKDGGKNDAENATQAA